jgi:hypothetical protein
LSSAVVAKISFAIGRCQEWTAMLTIRGLAGAISSQCATASIITISSAVNILSSRLSLWPGSSSVERYGFIGVSPFGAGGVSFKLGGYYIK